MSHGLRRLPRLPAGAPAAGPTDADLLARFAADRDAGAFAHLVRRHGPMVLAVCRRVLRHEQDAEDAFQATFLVLARRAAAVGRRHLLANWLYGVAYRTALEARRAAATRRAREQAAAGMRDAVVVPAGPEPDVRDVLDRELAALPEVYRAAVVVCDLEGLCRKEAAERLGWSEGTLSGRLARARALLARRLARYGLAVPAGVLGAAVPAGLAESTARLGVLVAAGEAAVVTAPVAALTQGVIKAMLLTKLKGVAVAAVAGCAILVTAAAGWHADAAGPQDRPAGTSADAPKKTAPKAQKTEQDRIAELERERDQLLKLVTELRAQVATLQDERKRADVAAQIEKARRVADAADEQAMKDVARLRASRTAPAANPATPPGTTSVPAGGARPAPSPAPPGTSGPAPGNRTAAPLPPGGPDAPLPRLEPASPAALPARLVTKVYPVDGLAADEKQAESLVRVLQKTVAPDSWDGRGGPGVAEYFAAGKSIVVRKTADVHKEVG